MTTAARITNDFKLKQHCFIKSNGWVHFQNIWGAVWGISLIAPFGWVYFQNIWSAVRGTSLFAPFEWVYFQNIWGAVSSISLTGVGVV